MKTETPGIIEKAQRKLSESIGSDEHLITFIAGYPLHSPSNALFNIYNLIFNTVCYIGLTNKKIILRVENAFGKVQRITFVPVAERKWAELRSNNLLDKIILLWGEDKRLDLLIYSQFRYQSRILTNVFCSNRQPPENYTPSPVRSSDLFFLIQSYAFADPKGLPTQVWFLLITGGALLFLFLASLGVHLIYPDPTPAIVSHSLLAIFFLIFGLAGWVAVRRKELPTQLWTFRDKLAGIIGGAIILIAWGLALWTLIDLLIQ